MYNDGHDRYAIKNIIDCDEITWEEYCNDRENYEKIFYDMMLSVDLHTSCSIEAIGCGKLYREKGNILRIRKDNMFSRVSADEPYAKWYMLTMFVDIVKKKGSTYSGFAEQICRLAERKPVVRISDDDAAMLREMFSCLYSLPVDDKAARDFQILALFDEIIRCIENGEKAEGEPILLGVDKMYKVTEYIKANIDSKLNVDEIADACYFDKFHLSKMFKKYTDHTINQFVTVYRVLRSIEYLFDGYSVETAGKMSGFKNVDTYIKAFKRVNCNITPKQFIKREI